MGALDAVLMRKIGAGESAGAGVITQDGTPETVWDAWPGLDAVELIPIQKWMHPMARLVVVAPHPDDEILACGGLMAVHARRSSWVASAVMCTSGLSICNVCCADSTLYWPILGVVCTICRCKLESSTRSWSTITR